MIGVVCQVMAEQADISRQQIVVYLDVTPYLFLDLLPFYDIALLQREAQENIHGLGRHMTATKRASNLPLQRVDLTIIQLKPSPQGYCPYPGA